MLTPTQAIKNALGTTRNTVGMCDRQVAEYYGYSSSGYSTAAVHWASIPATDKHPGDTNPPAGALVFWTGGSSGAGHVAISLGNGNIVSTDYPRSGITSQTTISAITNGWGEHYAGWSVPIFQGQVSSATFPASFIPSIPGLGSVLGGGGTVLDFLTGKFGTDVKDMAERLGLMLLGGILVLIGLFRIQGKNLSSVVSSAKSGKSTAKKTTNKEVSDAVDSEGSKAEAEIGE